ncbi:hypothetical protein MMC27_008844 [Xylographa pallens]|nr:hypothetical protein [Xylographa pallens]
MDTLSRIFLPEAKAVIKQLADRIEYGKVVGSFSMSIYDTAWLAMIYKEERDSGWLFPECFQYLLETQNNDGGWPAYASEMDGILNTMAAIVALRSHKRKLKLCAPAYNDISQRISKAEIHLRPILRDWDPSSAIHVGFEILVPTLLELLEKDSELFEFSGRQTLMTLNQSKLSRCSLEILYGKRKTTLIHSLEAFVGKIDFDRVAHHLDERGSMMASPSATAAYLIHSSNWSKSAEKYLLNVVALGSGKGNGGVPSAFPTSIFETAWIASTLLKTGFTCEALGLKETEMIGTFLKSQLESHSGIQDSELLADADDTAKSIMTTNLLGLPTSPDKMINEFEATTHFCTYKEELNESFSANCNVLDAILHSSSPGNYCPQIAKTAHFLSRGTTRLGIDKCQNLSENYSMMLLSQALAKLLRGWDSGELADLPEDLIHDQVPLVLFQILIRSLQKQASDGSWGLKLPFREVTAYAVLTLKTLSALPWLAHFRSRVQKAIRKGSTFLLMNYDEWDHEEYLWVEKVTYALTPLSRTYCLAALCADSFHAWGERVTGLMDISSERVTKLANFFSRLPMFSRDDCWLLEADVAEGCFYIPQLMRVSSNIFPRQKKINYKYLEYIPFTWIATNRRNNYPLSNKTLWETMIIALLDYQLDEFMETVFSEDEQMKNAEALKSIVRRLCEFPDYARSKARDDHVRTTIGNHTRDDYTSTNGTHTNGDINGPRSSNSESPDSPALEEIELVLSRFTSYIFQHPKVIQSPKHVRRQLHSELATCILTHIEHDEDNARFVAQKQQHALANSTPTSVSGIDNHILPFSSPRGTYYSWVRTTSADNTHCPFTFQFFTCLAALTPGEAFFHGVRQHYLSNALCRHLANLCRQYNDYGSVARDQAESNVNSLNFPEFHEPCRQPWAGGQAEVRDEELMKKDLFFIAEYERECMEDAMKKLEMEMESGEAGAWRTRALRAFVDTVDLYGQIYVVRDLTNRVK